MEWHGWYPQYFSSPIIQQHRVERNNIKLEAWRTSTNGQVRSTRRDDFGAYVRLELRNITFMSEYFNVRRGLSGCTACHILFDF